MTTDSYATGQLIGRLFLLLIFAPISVIFGAIILLLCGAIWGVGRLKSNHRFGRYTRSIVGAICASLLIVAVYIPAGPDPCSRSLTAQSYERCVGTIFEGMSISEARAWLETYGYKNSQMASLPLRDYGSRKHDIIFQAYRNYGPLKSIPYGTNFFRLFGRIPPAPSHFELAITALDSEDKILDVEVWWGFSFY